MSISSSLAAGVAGLNANSQRLASISDNIANSSTYGYKRAATDFHSMVIETGTDSRYTAGGVRTTTTRLIDERGQIENSGNATDIAVAGRGFLPVAQAAGLVEAGTPALKLMTTGSFRPDAQGILTDPTGQVLLGWPATNDGLFDPGFPRDSTDGLEPVSIFHNQYSANPTTQMTLHANLPASESEPTGTGTPLDLSLEYYGNLGQSETLEITFTADTVTGNAWRMEITDSAGGGALVGDYRLEFSDAAADGGTLINVIDTVGGAYVPADGTIEIAVAGGAIDIDIGMLNSPAGMTQLDSSFAPSRLDKNGSSVGNLLGVEIGGDGIIQAVYDSGFTRPIYQVPVIDVPNANGLHSRDNQTYTVSLESGDIFLWDAGTGPAGETIGYAREGSTTDVAHELTQMIQTQRAYSSNAKVIQTVDEMLQETTNLKR